jgi:hypothetical protein
VSGLGVLGLILAWGVAVAPGYSQEEPPPSAQGRSERRAEAFRMVDAYIIANIQEGLGLDDEQYARVVPLVNKLQKERREYYHARWQALHDMRRLLRSGAATQTQVERALDTLKALEVEGPARIEKQMEALDAVLTPVQRAKYRVFEVDVERRMRELMRRARRSRSQDAGPGP